MNREIELLKRLDVVSEEVDRINKVLNGESSIDSVLDLIKNNSERVDSNEDIKEC